MSKFNQIIENYFYILENGGSPERIDPSRVDVEIFSGAFLKEVGETKEDGTIVKGRFTPLEKEMTEIYLKKFSDARKKVETSKPVPGEPTKKPQWMIDREKYEQQAREILGDTGEEETNSNFEAKDNDSLKNLREKPIESFKYEFKHRSKTKKLKIIGNQSIVEFLRKEAGIKDITQVSFPLFGVEVWENDPSIHLLFTKVPSIKPGKEIIIWLTAFNVYNDYSRFTSSMRAS